MSNRILWALACIVVTFALGLVVLAGQAPSKQEGSTSKKDNATKSRPTIISMEGRLVKGVPPDSGTAPTWSNFDVKGSATNAYPGRFEQHVTTFAPEKNFVADFKITDKAGKVIVNGNMSGYEKVSGSGGGTVGGGGGQPFTAFNTNYKADIQTPNGGMCKLEGKARINFKGAIQPNFLKGGTFAETFDARKCGAQ